MSTLPKEILVATGNEKKLAELAELMRAAPFELRFLPQLAAGDVAETGSTFAENARIKAREYARRAQMWTMADDSGLVVDALDGRPGIFSARYGGGDLSDRGRLDLVLSQMRGKADRLARFVCAVAIADAGGNIVAESEGICEGRIAHAPGGSGGFGYDPIFIPEGQSQTFAEISTAEKQKISHRARAVDQILRYLLHLNEL